VLTVEELTALEFKQLAQERETTEPDPDMWRWSPLEMRLFIPMISVATAAAADGFRVLRAAEAGSGIGTKLYYMKNYCNLDVTGYEINDEYIARSRELGVKTEKCDLRADNPPWGKFDIVYVARHLKDDDAQVAWEKKVRRDMRRGAVWVAAYVASKPYDWECLYRASFRGVWRKPLSVPPNYTAAIARHTTGSDPLVPEPAAIR
jgi:hypothetical protein